jgi:uncharacterized protein
MSQKRRLFASIHDVTPVHKQRLEKLVPLVENCVGSGKFALLAVPDFHGEGLIDSDRAFASRLRGWSDDGCEVFLHGFTHRDTARHVGRLAGFKARHLTASEGEFLSLDHATASRILIEGRKRVEDVIGRSVAGFIAPAWLYSDDAQRAIADLGFALAEDHFRVWHPVSGTVLARGPVVTYASRSPARLLSSLAWSRIASVVLKPFATVRLGVHPHDVDAPELVNEIKRALTAFIKTHRPSHYKELLTPAHCDITCGSRSLTASDLL